MDCHQPVVMSNSSFVAESPLGNSEGFVGFLEVYIYQARDIHNICIYHKQDVYAKLCLTGDPETTVSTQIINGGGKNPVFNENLRLNVRSVDSSLKCEIWMLSRIRNYLEDQLLGFTLVSLSDVLIGNGKLAQEFSLSSNDLFHSSAGFVQLTLTYSGASPQVLEIPRPGSSLTATAAPLDSEIPTYEFEFPDPKLVNENEMMVSEYFGIPCSDLEKLGTTENDNHFSSEEIGVCIVESFSRGSLVEVSKVGTPPTSLSSNGSPSVSILASSQSACDTPGTSKSSNQDAGSSTKESGFSVLVNIEAEQKVVQQEIVDLYMKSVQQFTESLAKMKLPMDIENGSANSENTGSDEKVLASKGNGPSPRVFYGSRAFF
uniref:C2 domain-containing protein n=1 Tax=Davidia involucrata TaxID=16924 RepID=A0A5B6ZUZ7_DAVIN